MIKEKLIKEVEKLNGADNKVAMHLITNKGWHWFLYECDDEDFLLTFVIKSKDVFGNETIEVAELEDEYRKGNIIIDETFKPRTIEEILQGYELNED